MKSGVVALFQPPLSAGSTSPRKGLEERQNSVVKEPKTKSLSAGSAKTPPALPGGERNRSGAQEGSQPPLQTFSARKFQPGGKPLKKWDLTQAGTGARRGSVGLGRVALRKLK